MNIVLLLAISLFNSHSIKEYKDIFFNKNYNLNKDNYYEFNILNIGQGLFTYFKSKNNPNQIFIYDSGTMAKNWVKDYKVNMKNTFTNVICAENNKIIAFLSHPHLDHISLFKKMIKKTCLKNISSIAFIINTIYFYNLEHYSRINLGGVSIKNIYNNRKVFLNGNLLKNNKYSNKIGLFKVDDFKDDNYEISFGLAKFKFLFDVEKDSNFNLNRKNCSSLIIKFYVNSYENGVLLTGDATNYTYNNLFRDSEKYLKSKIFQVSHHGSNIDKSNNLEFIKKVAIDNSISITSSPPFPNYMKKNNRGSYSSLGSYNHPFGIVINDLNSLFSTNCITGNHGNLKFLFYHDRLINYNRCPQIYHKCTKFKEDRRYCYIDDRFSKLIEWTGLS